MPLLIQLLPLPSFLNLCLYQLTVPSDHSTPWYHHVFVLLMTLWLITVGPAAKPLKIKKE